MKKEVGQPFLVHFTRNTIKTHSKLSPGDPFGASIWSRTSPAGPPGRPGWLALPGWPLGRLAGQAGVLAGQERPQQEESPWLALTGRRPARPRSGRHDNSVPPLLSPQVGYLVYTHIWKYSSRLHRCGGQRYVVQQCGLDTASKNAGAGAIDRPPWM